MFVLALSNPGQLQKAQQQLRRVPPLPSLGEISILIKERHRGEKKRGEEERSFNMKFIQR